MDTNLYTNPDLYDVGVEKRNEAPLIDHYKRLFAGKQIKSIHDCSIGTGHLTFALADLGCSLSGSDLSEDMLRNARKRADDKGLDVDLVQSDFCLVDQVVRGQFDCVLSTGNSLPHVDNGRVKEALAAMVQMTKPGGYVYVDLRNWDKIIAEKQRYVAYQPMILDEERVNIVQFWDHHSEDHVCFNLLYTFERNARIFKEELKSVDYYPLKRDVLVKVLVDLGLEDIEVHHFVSQRDVPFEQMNWYCVMAKKPSDTSDAISKNT